jgi:transposase
VTKIGVDAHSTFLVATTLRDDKKSRERADLENLELWAASLDPDAEVVLEASTNACHIHDVLLPHVKRVVVAHPLYLRWIAESRMKTDKLDSEKLALLLKADLIPEVWVPSPAQRELRAAVQRREKLVAARTRE